MKSAEITWNVTERKECWRNIALVLYQFYFTCKRCFRVIQCACGVNVLTNYGSSSNVNKHWMVTYTCPKCTFGKMTHRSHCSPYILQWPAHAHPQKCLSSGRIRPPTPSNVWLLGWLYGSTRISLPNGILIGSAVYAEHTDRHTDHARCDTVIGLIIIWKLSAWTLNNIECSFTIEMAQNFDGFHVTFALLRWNKK